MIVGYHAPPARAHTGVADYAASLERALSSFATVRRSAATADVHLYHLGNNLLHREIYRRALETPGVAVLHDAVLHHFMLGALSEPQYLEEFALNYGEWHRQTARKLWRDRAAAGTDPRYFRYPMLRRIVNCSAALIVHNPGAEILVREAATGVRTPPIFVIPHLYAPLAAPPATPGDFRKRIGVPAAATLFGIFGYLREPKRVPACIRAFRRLHEIRPDTALLLAGEAVSKDLARALDAEAVHPAIHRLEHLKPRDFTAALAAIDCCINLRFPGAGETSGIAIQAMGAGKPVILTENPENSGFPADSCLRMATGPGEAAELFDWMSMVTEFPSVARRVGAAAQRHVLSRHAPDRVAKMYLDALTVAAEAAEMQGAKA